MLIREISDINQCIILQDKAANFTTRHFVTEKMGPELLEIINKYQPQVSSSSSSFSSNDQLFLEYQPLVNSASFGSSSEQNMLS
jgi:hypothetical protein